MSCFICGRSAYVNIGEVAVCETHCRLIEKYLEPQTCHICEQVAPMVRIAIDRDGSEMAVCRKCCDQIDLDKHLVLKCRGCGHATAHLKSLFVIGWLETAERMSGWPAVDYIGLAMKGEPILRDITACPRCGYPGQYLFPRFKNGGRPQRFLSWPEFDRREPCTLERDFPKIVKFFTQGERGQHPHASKKPQE